MEAWKLQISIIGLMSVLSGFSGLVTNAGEKCNGSFQFENTTIHGNKLTANANTKINITFLLNYDSCNNSRDFDIEISRLDNGGARYLPQCSIIGKNDTCRDSLNITNLTCGCLDDTDKYFFAKTVTESDSTDWKWRVKYKTVSAVISFNITDNECKDTRTDCFLIANKCHEAHLFIIAGCRKTCALCSTIITDSENECQDIPTDCHLLANNCSSANYSMLSGCKKMCIFCNKAFGKSPAKPFFYLTSDNENDTNITVSENQTVNFVCTPGNMATKSLVLVKEYKIENESQGLIDNSSEDFSVSNSYTYTIRSVQCNDSGVYRCVAFNLHGTNYSSATLRVECDKHECKLNGECVTDHRETSTKRLSSNEIVAQYNSNDVNSTRITLAVIGAFFVVSVAVLFVLLNKYRDYKLFSKLHTILPKRYVSEQTHGLTSGPSSREFNNYIELHQIENDTAVIEGQCVSTLKGLPSSDRSRDVSMQQDGLIYTTLDLTTTQLQTLPPVVVREINEYAVIDFRKTVSLIDE